MFVRTPQQWKEIQLMKNETLVNFFASANTLIPQNLAISGY